MEATSYHVDVCNYLIGQEPDLWRWGQSAAQDDLQQVRLHLLKTTHLLSLEAHPELHAAAARAAHTLGISAAISLYQSDRSGAANVAVYTAAGEAHITFHGPVLALLSTAETDAVLGHELAHYLLWQRDGQRYWIASRILDRLALEEAPPGVWAATAQRYHQYTEIVADRGAFAVCGDIHPCITSLGKIQGGGVLAEGASGEPAAHPPHGVRARALALHAEGAASIDATLAPLLAGPLHLDRLDILGQVELYLLTRSVLARLLAPAWFSSENALALARRYYSDYQHGEAPLARHIGVQGVIVLPPDHQLGQFFSFVLLDFAYVDPLLEELPLAAALRIADDMAIGDDFEALLLKEATIKKTALTKLKAARDELLAQAQT